MTVVIIATLFALAALITGILAVGSGSKWQFHASDIFKGRKNALLYVWVTFSTMFSMAHFFACFQYLLSPTWGYGIEVKGWFLIHAMVGIILSFAHGYIHLIMKREGATQAYLWGPLRNV